MCSSYICLSVYSDVVGALVWVGFYFVFWGDLSFEEQLE